MTKFTSLFLAFSFLLIISSSAFAADYECKAVYTKSSASPSINIQMKKGESPSGKISIGGRGENCVAVAEIDEQTGQVQLTIRRNDQTVQVIGAFTQSLSSQVQVFQAALNTDTNAIAGPGIGIFVECTKTK